MISFVVTCSAARPLPSAASRYFLGLLQESRNSLKINTYKNRISKSFRMNTYEKTGGGGLAVPKWDSLPPQMPYALASLFHFLTEERNASPIVSTVCSLFAQNNRGVPQLFFIPTSPSEGPQREPPLAPTLHTHKFAVSLEPESVQLPVPHSGLSLKTENLQLITPATQPRLIRHLAR